MDHLPWATHKNTHKLIRSIFKEEKTKAKVKVIQQINQNQDLNSHLSDSSSFRMHRAVTPVDR